MGCKLCGDDIADDEQTSLFATETENDRISISRVHKSCHEERSGTSKTDE